MIKVEMILYNDSNVIALFSGEMCYQTSLLGKGFYDW